jgi:hypothetical protein
MAYINTDLMQRVVRALLLCRDWAPPATIYQLMARSHAKHDYSERDVYEMLNRLVTLGVAEIKADKYGNAVYTMNPLGMDIVASLIERADFDRAVGTVAAFGPKLIWASVIAAGLALGFVLAKAIVNTVTL